MSQTIAYTLHGNLYLNITNRCTLRCAFCPKFNGTWVVQGYNLREKIEPGAQAIITAAGDVTSYNQIVFCGLGEPTLRLDVVLEVAAHFKRQGARTRLNTDGLANLIHGRDVVPELATCLDMVSVSLNAQDEATYNRHCRPLKDGAYAAMLDFIERASKRIPTVIATAIDGLEGVDIAACKKIAEARGAVFRRRVLDDVG